MYGMKQNNSIKKHCQNINIFEGGFGERKGTLVVGAGDKSKYNRHNVYIDYTYEIYIGFGVIFNNFVMQPQR